MALSDHARGQSGPESSDLTPSLLSSALLEPWDLLYPSKTIRTEVLDTARTFLGSLSLSVNDSQSTRQRNQRKRRRIEDDRGDTSVLGLKELYVDGFTTNQIWEQALRIFDSAHHEIERDYTTWVQNVRQPAVKYPDDTALLGSHHHHHHISSNDDSASRSEGAIGQLSESSGEFDIGLEEEPSQSDVDQIDSEGLGSERSVTRNTVEQNDTYVEDRFGLNDGFFSIDDFNKQTELIERQDARVDLIENSDGDEDEIDWDANPLGAGGSISSHKNADNFNADMSESDEDGEGPIFDNLGAAGDSDADEDESHSASLGGAAFFNTSDIKYDDFFAPPLRKVSNKRSRPLPKTQPDNAISDNDVDRAMADVRRDLFDDEISSDSGDESLRDSTVHRSAHEKQRARIADEIRRLEAANVAKREWMVSGEARAAERPINSLIEEDLDFERIGKPVPVVTPELSESIEELIKRRIIAKDFDEVMRRRPGLSDRQSTQRARVELEDTKSQQGLAELYEADHLRSKDLKYVDPKNQKLLKEHTEITNLWNELSSQLDILSNWHYKPKAPQPMINVVTDVATITMEDAQPVASGAVRAAATLAPQELYAPGETTGAIGELVMRNGVPVAKEEMTREDKAKARRRTKKISLAVAEPLKQQTGKAAEKHQIISDLKRGSVKLVGKEGEVTDINGSKSTGTSDKNGAHAMKL
ncbi:U3 small nucleolar ribonucleoprotein complex, subunit Mpp10 [Aspergillus crustosus]